MRRRKSARSHEYSSPDGPMHTGAPTTALAGGPSPAERRFSRNRGFVTLDEQAQLARSTIAVAGVGGDGGQAALALARLGVGGFRLADPERFEEENINRQAGADSRSLGENKAQVIARVIRRINPEAAIATYTDGVTSENVQDFVSGADLVLDETEYTLPHLGVMVARTARAQSIPVATGLNVGFGALVTTFDPRGRTLEAFLGLKPEMTLDDVAVAEIPLGRWIPILPRYAHVSTLRLVESAAISAPSVAPGVNLAASMLSTEAFKILTGRSRPVVAPKMLWADAYIRRAKVIRPNSLSFLASFAQLKVRSSLKLNPPY